MALNERQKRFAEHLVSGCTATEAYRRAGYSGAGSAQSAYRLSGNAEVKRYAESLSEQARANCVLSLERVLDEIQAIAFGVGVDSVRLRALETLLAHLKAGPAETDLKSTYADIQREWMKRFAGENDD